MGLVAYVTSQRLDVVEDKFEFDVEDYWENKLFDQTFVSKHKCLIKLILGVKVLKKVSLTIFYALKVIVCYKFFTQIFHK